MTPQLDWKDDNGVMWAEMLGIKYVIKLGDGQFLFELWITWDDLDPKANEECYMLRDESDDADSLKKVAQSFAFALNNAITKAGEEKVAVEQKRLSVAAGKSLGQLAYEQFVKTKFLEGPAYGWEVLNDHSHAQWEQIALAPVESLNEQWGKDYAKLIDQISALEAKLKLAREMLKRCEVAFRNTAYCGGLVDEVKQTLTALNQSDTERPNPECLENDQQEASLQAAQGEKN